MSNAADDFMDGGDRMNSTDSEYWYRLGTTAFDEADDDPAETRAEEWETKFFGTGNVRLGPKRQRGPSVEIHSEVLTSGPTVMEPRPTASQISEPQPKTLNARKAYEAAREITESFFGKEKVTVTRLGEKNRAVLIAAFDHMLQTFDSPRFHQRYGQGSEPHHSTLRFGEPVPSYFANVGGQSIYYRKVLSIAGLRNLIEYGPIIYSQLESTKFSGNPSSYQGNTGLNLMRAMTGNVVDLDTTVLRCSDRLTMEVINTSNRHKGLPVFSSCAEFGTSTQAAEIAVNCSRPLLEDFVKRFKLSESDAQQRRVHVSDLNVNSIPIAHDNSTRGHCALWHYVNAGQDSFHCNVPSMDDVVGALLRAPFACVEHYAGLQLQFSGTALDAELDEFFETAVVDSCFNMKWKAIEEFGEALQRRGTVVEALQQLQSTHQRLFTNDFFDSDTETHDAEIALMTKLCEQENVQGKDRSGRLRPITSQDVRKWVDANYRNERIII